jgi:beta-lactamase regulating signal transducer with metallopeptidase domain
MMSAAIDWLLVVQLKGAMVLVLAHLVAWALTRSSAAVRRGAWACAACCVLLVPVADLLLPSMVLPALPGTGEFLSTTTGAAAVSGVAVDGSVAGTPTSPLARLISALAVVWAVGCAVLLGRHVHAVSRAHRLGAGARATGPGVGVLLRTSPDIDMPLTVGLFRPSILVPVDFAAWPEAVQRSTLLHERAHVARRDCLFMTLGALARAFCWIDPLAWNAARRLRLEAEKAADDSVVADGVRPSDYASQLLQLARGPCLRAAPAGLPIADHSAVGERIRSILAPDLARRPARLRHAVPLVLATLGATLSLAIIEAGGSSQPPGAHTATGETATDGETDRVVLHGNGELDLNGQVVTLEGLRTHLCRERDHRTPPALELATRRSTDHGFIVEVMDVARSCGIERLAVGHGG